MELKCDINLGLHNWITKELSSSFMIFSNLSLFALEKLLSKPRVSGISVWTDLVLLDVSNSYFEFVPLAYRRVGNISF